MALRTRLRGLLEQAGSQMLASIEPPRDPLAKEGPEPPVVARLVVEVRSDGSRTIARGALEGGPDGDTVAIEARGTTPAQLAASLARAVLSAPMLWRGAASSARSLPREKKSAPRRRRQPR